MVFSFLVIVKIVTSPLQAVKMDLEIPKIPDLALNLVRKWDISNVWRFAVHRATIQILMSQSLVRKDMTHYKNLIVNLAHLFLMAHVGVKYPFIITKDWMFELSKAVQGK